MTVFAGILLLPSLTIGILSYTSAKNEINTKIHGSAMDNLQMLNSTIDNSMKAKVHDMNYFAKTLDASLYTPAQLPQLETNLTQYVALHPDIIAAYVGTEQGKMYVSPKEDLPPDFDPRQRPWYQDAMKQGGKVVITDPYVTASTGDVVVSIVQMLADKSGVIGIDINLKNIMEFTKLAKIGDEGYSFILDKNRKTVVHPVIKSGTESKEAYFDQVYTGQQGEFTYMYEGAEKNMVYYTNELTGWKLLGSMFKSEVEKSTQGIFNTTVLVVVSALLLGFLVAFFFIRSILGPIRVMRAAAQKISDGDLTETITIRSSDELGELASAFNRMSANLREVISRVSGNMELLASSAEQLTVGANETGTATEQIVTIIQEVATGSDKQVQSVESSAHAMKEMTLSVQHVAANTSDAAASAVQTLEKSREGNKVVSSAVDQMKSIRETVGGLAGAVQGLGARSDEIGKISGMISGLANQTNLLALNAAIEAARVGEQGKGFAVVASEVRKLAEQSAASSKQIAELVSLIQAETKMAIGSMDVAVQEVADGIVAVQTAGEKFEDIDLSVNDVAGQIEQVSAAIQQIAASVEQVSHSIDQVAGIADATAAGTETVSAATEEQLASMQEMSHSASSLHKMAQELKSITSKFQV
ncbi:methyl-accepting chemotaxis protein [Paenibacillus caseinilyticus]|nr:methyl-accepting chemotaxis protein [Paenibacillus caseinilyticus]MCZ8523912.1 methyl-accepting chemotaxis protein [Paenibacillus caseinilyticus]